MGISFLNQPFFSLRIEQWWAASAVLSRCSGYGRFKRRTNLIYDLLLRIFGKIPPPWYARNTIMIVTERDTSPFCLNMGMKSTCLNSFLFLFIQFLIFFLEMCHIAWYHIFGYKILFKFIYNVEVEIYSINFLFRFGAVQFIGLWPLS